MIDEMFIFPTINHEVFVVEDTKEYFKYITNTEISREKIVLVMQVKKEMPVENIPQLFSSLSCTYNIRIIVKLIK